MKKFILKLFIIAAILNISACASKNSEQQESKAENSAALLDGSGVVFVNIPGVIVYAVDFNNETVYLPKAKRKTPKIQDLKKENMDAVTVAKQNFNAKTIESIVTAQVGCTVDFKKAQSYKLDKNGKKVRVL